MQIVFPKKLYEKALTVVFVTAVMGILVPSVAVMAYQSYSQQRMLSRVDRFIKTHGAGILIRKYGNIEKLYGYTGDGGRLGVIHSGEIDKAGLENFVYEKDKDIQVMYHSYR